MNCRISGCGTAGVHVNPGLGGVPAVFVSGTTLADCVDGLEVINGTVSVTGSTLSQNSGNGVAVSGGTFNNIRNTFNQNGQDISRSGGTVNSFNNFMQSGINVATTSPVQTIQAGGTATYSITVNPPPGGFASPLTFSCSGLPTRLTGSFSPATAPAGTSPVSTVLTIQAAATAGVPLATASLPPSERAEGTSGRPEGTASAAVLVCVGGWLLMRRRVAAPTWSALPGGPSPERRGLPALVLGLVLLAGCGGGDGTAQSSSTPTTTTATVSATTASPSPSPTVLPTGSPTVSPSPTVTTSPTATPAPTVTPSPSPTLPKGAVTFTVTARSGTQSATQTLTVNVQ